MYEVVSNPAFLSATQLWPGIWCFARWHCFRSTMCVLSSRRKGRILLWLIPRSASITPHDVFIHATQPMATQPRQPCGYLEYHWRTVGWQTSWEVENVSELKRRPNSEELVLGIWQCASSRGRGVSTAGNKGAWLSVSLCVRNAALYLRSWFF